MVLKTKVLLFTLLLALGASIKTQAQYEPKANPKAVVNSGNMRFTVLTPEMIRIEWSETKQFEDRASFIVVNRKFDVPRYTKESKNGYLYIKTDKLELKYKEGSYPISEPMGTDNLSISFDLNGKKTVWYPGKKDPLNLKGTTRTLDHSKGDNMREVMEDGILSRAGWVLIDEAKTNGDGSKSLLLENQGGKFDWVVERESDNFIDWYFMCYGHDYKKALYDYTQLGGKMPMPPLYSLGYWYSKYERYSEKDFKDIVNDIQDNDIPIDIMVIDMDWHYAGNEADNGRGGWTGWTWNKNLIPDPDGLISWLHDRNIKTTLNLHPADGVAVDEDIFEGMAKELNAPKNETIKWNIENQSFYNAFANNFLRPEEEMGIDFWWLDWQQWPIAPNVKDLGNTFWLNHVFYNDMRTNWPNRRPMIFHRWGGLGNHRYPIGFSGDSWATFPTLAFQIYYNSTASNVAYGYWSHDLGGHNQAGPNDPELYLRWIQFGVFSPAVRTHATNAPHIERRIWKYPNFELMRDAIKLRYRMMPYIYTYARYAYDTGISLCRPLYYDSPEENEAYKDETTYMFGNEILLSPIVAASDSKTGVSTKRFWLPEGKWMEAETGSVLEGKQKHSRSFAQDEIPYYYKEGAIIPMYPDIKHLREIPDTLIIEFIPGKSGEFAYYEDNGDNDKYKNGEFTTTKITQQTNNTQGTYTIQPREGQFDGMLKSRSYKLLLTSKLPAVKVAVNGVEYPYSSKQKSKTWSYCGNSLTIVVNIPNTDCSSETKIVVDFDEKQADSDILIAGKKGQMKRIAQCNDSLMAISANKLPASFTKLVETSKRINSNPKNTIKELSNFDKNVSKAFDDLMKAGALPKDEVAEWKNFVINFNSSCKKEDKSSAVNAEVKSAYWIVGSAVPGGSAKLTEDPAQRAGFYRYLGELNEGEFKIVNAPTVEKASKCYVPALEDVNAVGNNHIVQTTDSELAGWQVTINDNYYKIHINTLDNTVDGEIYRPREDLFIIGGATKAGWDVSKAIRLARDEDNPSVFTFVGELKITDEGDDRNMFKILGQLDWTPVAFHPETPEESILKSKYLFENLPGDHKWTIAPDEQGMYKIIVDLFKNTIIAEYLGDTQL